MLTTRIFCGCLTFLLAKPRLCDSADRAEDLVESIGDERLFHNGVMKRRSDMAQQRSNGGGSCLGLWGLLNQTSVMYS